MRLFAIFLFLVASPVLAETICEKIQARARCRQIFVKKHDVVVRFTCEEDARLFARDLHLFIRD